MNAKRLTILAGLILILALSLFACPVDVICPLHGEPWHCYFTGTRIIDGIMVGVYKCPRGHEVIARCM